MEEMPDFSGECRPLQHSSSQGDACRPDFVGRLRLIVAEVLGTSPEIKTGDKYIVRGRYELSGGEDAVSLGAIVSGRSLGHYIDLAPGSGEFVVWTEVLEVRGGRGRNIGLMVGTTEDRECGDVHTSIRIRE